MKLKKIAIGQILLELFIGLVTKRLCKEDRTLTYKWHSPFVHSGSSACHIPKSQSEPLITHLVMRQDPHHKISCNFEMQLRV